MTSSLTSAMKGGRRGSAASDSGDMAHSSAARSQETSGRRSNSPGHFPQRSNSPGRFPQRSNSPGRFTQRSGSPGRFVQKPDSPGCFGRRAGSPRGSPMRSGSFRRTQDNFNREEPKDGRRTISEFLRGAVSPKRAHFMDEDDMHPSDDSRRGCQMFDDLKRGPSGRTMRHSPVRRPMSLGRFDDDRFNSTPNDPELFGDRGYGREDRFSRYNGMRRPMSLGRYGDDRFNRARFDTEDFDDRRRDGEYHDMNRFSDRHFDRRGRSPSRHMYDQFDRFTLDGPRHQEGYNREKYSVGHSSQGLGPRRRSRSLGKYGYDRMDQDRYGPRMQNDHHYGRYGQYDRNFSGGRQYQPFNGGRSYGYHGHHNDGSYEFDGCYDRPNGFQLGRDRFGYDRFAKGEHNYERHGPRDYQN